MTLRPIPGAPIDAPIPDFPTGEPAPLVVPESRFARRPVEAFSLPGAPPETSTSIPPVQRSGPVEIRGSGASTLIFRSVPEIPAITRSRMIISIAGEPAHGGASPTMPQLDLTTDAAKAFLLALRDGRSPVVIADGRTMFQLEFAIAADGPTFTVSKPGHEQGLRKFNAGWSYDVKAMAEHLLAELGP